MARATQKPKTTQLQPTQFGERLLPLFLAFFVICLALSLSALVFIKIDAPTGVDFYYHLEYAKEYASAPLDLGNYWSVFWNSPENKANNGPYPPLFHLALAIPLILGGATGDSLALLFGRFIELFAYFIPIALVSYFAFKHKGPWAAALAAVLLFTSSALFDRGAQATPQALDMVVFPLVAIAMLWQPKPKKALVVLPLAAAIWAHGAYALLFAGGLVLFFVHKMFEEKFVNHPDTHTRFCLVQKALFWSLPIILVILLGLPAQLTYAGGVNNAQEALIWKEPLFGFWYAGAALSAILLPSLIYFVFRELQKKQEPKRAPGDFEWLSVCWLIGLLPMLFAFPDRFASYAAMPVALLGAWFLTESLSVIGGRYKTIALTALFLLILATALAWNYLGWWTSLGLAP